MLSGPICAMVWEGRSAVKTGRGMLIETLWVSSLLNVLTYLQIFSALQTRWRQTLVPFAVIMP